MYGSYLHTITCMIEKVSTIENNLINTVRNLIFFLLIGSCLVLQCIIDVLPCAVSSIGGSLVCAPSAHSLVCLIKNYIIYISVSIVHIYCKYMWERDITIKIGVKIIELCPLS